VTSVANPTEQNGYRGLDGSLVRAIGVWGLAASIVNVTVGGGIFRIPGSREVSGVLGPAAPLAYIACAVLMGLIMLCIAQVGSRVSLTGGPYAYVEVTLGPFVGFLVGVLLWLIGATAIPGVATIFADAAGKLIPSLAGWGGRALFLAVMFGIISGINILGVRQGTRLNLVFTVAKLTPLLLLVLAGLFAIRGENLRWSGGAPPVTDVSRASIVLIFIFAGVEAALVPSGEVRDSSRTVPRAVLMAMLGVTLLYLGLQVVAQGVLGPQLVGDATPLATAAERVLGPWGATMISVGLLISAFGYLSGMMLAVPRSLFAFARDGLLPRQLATVHPRFHTPWVAIVVQGIVAWALAVTNQFEALVIIANISVLLIYLGCAIAAAKIQRSARETTAAFTVPGGLIVPILATLAVLFLLSSVTLKEAGVLVAVLGVASLLYFIVKVRR
jgi:APA family basic amino acid/polyamine antiporter